MNYPLMKFLSVLLPTLLIGGFEYLRHDILLHQLSMETGNLYITLLTLLLSYAFTFWMFGKIEKSNARLVREQSMRAVYEERERLAAELHDNIAQTLFFLNVKLQKGHLDEAKSAVSEINDELRQAIFNLRALPDEGAGIKERLERWMAEWSLLSGVDTETDIRLTPHFFSPSEEILLFGVVQEAFTNIRKHSNADKCRLHLNGDAKGWSMCIMDNGNSIDSPSPQAPRYGLPLMRKRALILEAERDSRVYHARGYEPSDCGIARHYGAYGEESCEKYAGKAATG